MYACVVRNILKFHWCYNDTRLSVHIVGIGKFYITCYIVFYIIFVSERNPKTRVQVTRYLARVIKQSIIHHIDASQCSMRRSLTSMTRRKWLFMAYLVEEINFTKLIKQSIIRCTDTSRCSMGQFLIFILRLRYLSILCTISLPNIRNDYLSHMHFQSDFKFYQCDQNSRVSLQNEQNSEKSRVTGTPPGYGRRSCVL